MCTVLKTIALAGLVGEAPRYMVVLTLQGALLRVARSQLEKLVVTQRPF